MIVIESDQSSTSMIRSKSKTEEEAEEQLSILMIDQLRTF